MSDYSTDCLLRAFREKKIHFIRMEILTNGDFSITVDCQVEGRDSNFYTAMADVCNKIPEHLARQDFRRPLP